MTIKVNLIIVWLNCESCLTVADWCTFLFWLLHCQHKIFSVAPPCYFSPHVLDYPFLSYSVQVYSSSGARVVNYPFLSYSVRVYSDSSAWVLNYPFLSYSVWVYSDSNAWVLNYPFSPNWISASYAELETKPLTSTSAVNTLIAYASCLRLGARVKYLATLSMCSSSFLHLYGTASVISNSWRQCTIMSCLSCYLQITS